MVAKSHRNQYSRRNRADSHTSWVPEKKCPNVRGKWTQPRPAAQQSNPESSQRCGPRHLGMVYATVSVTESSSDEYDPRPRERAPPSTEEPLLSMITSEQLRQSIRRRKVPPKTLKKPHRTELKELHVQDFPKTLRVHTPITSRTSDLEVPRSSPCRTFVAGAWRSVKYPHRQDRQGEVALQSPRHKTRHDRTGAVALQSLRHKTRDACGLPDAIPKKPPSLAKEDINVVRQHLQFQRESSANLSIPLRRDDNTSVVPRPPIKPPRHTSVRRKLSVVVRRDVGHQYFRRMRPTIVPVDSISDDAPQKPAPLPREDIHRGRSPESHLEARGSYSSSDSSDAHYSSHIHEHTPAVSANKCGSTWRKPAPLPKQATNRPELKRQDTFSLTSSESSEEHYTEPRPLTFQALADHQQPALLHEKEPHASHQLRTIAQPRSNSLSSLASNPMPHFTSKQEHDGDGTTLLVPVAQSRCPAGHGTMRLVPVAQSRCPAGHGTMRLVPVAQSRCPAPTSTWQESRVYETFKVKKMEMRPAKPTGPRDIDPYACYFTPVCRPYKRKKRFKQLGRVATCGGIYAVFRALFKRT